MNEEESIRCPICGTVNKPDSESCTMCKTKLKKKTDGSLGVSSPKSRGKTHIMIDIEDPLTRKKLEELTLIPGVTRKKALMLYQAGIHSMEEFLMKALHGERFSANYSRTVANKLLVQSLGGKKKGSVDIPCPSCKAPNPANSIKCKVCNFDIKEDMDSVDLDNLSGTISESVGNILTELSESEDFESLPEELKKQFACLVESDDVDFDAEKPKDLEALGIDLDKLDEMAEESSGEDVAADAPETAEEPPAETPEPEIQKEKPETVMAAEPESEKNANPEKKKKQDKIRGILQDKLIKWRKAGYEITELEQYLDDVEGFKEKAKMVLGNGKVVKQRYKKQIEMWKEKGFDVSELEPILETDVDMFPEKAKEILKKQKNK
ncbi:MAG: zinc finger Ran-binding domain-containing protein [Candidatus Thermoplasmatota archaeon]|nr:hypothetical protein [Euryarchaeota archaeon]MBU4031258.1 zinc finger Ran-binding domain-containing protein [Candidatus Thermoplasmatota archaeon]MBU4072260.1 zinc finger Ran-binding domain-containing protein [Candidatus Thermoplasmatota archaeon]MBU4144961.1 zinc finger Ran-binding domain-containing protein [Candidatus Thermoplasmatota archaeon]MBU4592053.1 zinc finger Ran-binding domain-containing protein [Candidatus Thermoplasmatota archaeon]